MGRELLRRRAVMAVRPDRRDELERNGGRGDEPVLAERSAVRLLADVGDLGLCRAAPVAEDYGAVAFKAFIPIERLCILFEAVCKRAEKLRHRGAISLAPPRLSPSVHVGIF